MSVSAPSLSIALSSFPSAGPVSVPRSPMAEPSGKTMRQEWERVGQIGVGIGQLSVQPADRIGGIVVDHLRRRYPVQTAKNVCADTRGLIGVNTVAKWLERANSPSGAALLVLIATYGATFLRELLAAGWIEEAALREEADALRREREAIEARMERVEALL